MASEETSRSLSAPPAPKFSRRRATSQVASPIVDFDVAIAEKPYKSPHGKQAEKAPKSYYIINPKVPGVAWYLTRGKGNSDAHEYEVERVRTHLVDIQQNRTGCLVETATRDDVTGAAADPPVSWTHKHWDSWSTSATSSTEKPNNGAEAEPGKRVNRFEKVGSEGTFKMQPHNESTIVMKRRDIPLITKRIVRQLQIAGLKQNRRYMKAGGTQNGEALAEKELEKIIEATLLEFRKSVQFSDTLETDEDASPRSKLPAQFALGTENPRTKPRSSIVADPTITLSIPQTASTVTGSNHKINEARQKGQREASPTLVSQQSATSMTSTKQGSLLGEPYLTPDSTSISSKESSKNNSQECLNPSCKGHKQEQGPATSQASIESTSTASTITSFPKLLSRHCTREWIKPLVGFEDTSADKSYQIVDDHSGRLSLKPDTYFTDNTIPTCWPGDSFHSLDTSGYFSDEAANRRRSTVSQSSLASGKSFGTQIGSAAHRRRSTSTYNKGPPSQDQFFPNFLSSFFASRNEGDLHPDSKKAMDSSDLDYHNLPDHINTSPGSRTGSFKERTSPVPVKDEARM